MAEHKDQWVDELIQQLVSGKKYKRLIQRCIANMGDNKKLYKYYDFNSGYTLGNIEGATNYYNNPVSFNDPFDCNIGMSVDQIIRILLPDLFDRIYQPTIDQPIKNMIEALMFEDGTELCKDEITEAISKCVNNPAFIDMLFRAKNGEMIEESELISFLIYNPDVLTSIIKGYSLENGMEISTFQKEDIERVVLHSTGFLREIIKRGGENQPENIKQMISVFDEQGDFLKKVSKIARLVGAHVPDEQIKQLYGQLNEMVRKVHGAIGDMVGISCFSETPYNMLMWSHYANKHTGICVEYDFSKLFSTVPNSLLLPVHYTSKRPLLPIEMMMTCKNEKIEWDQSKVNLILPAVLKSLAIKSEVWDYEREWRHVVFTKDTPDRIARLPIISKIILGINISRENRAKVLAVAKEKGIQVCAASMKSDKYEMVLSSVE